MLDSRSARGRTLDALCRRILPHAYEGDISTIPRAASPLSVVEARIARLPAALARDVPLALVIFGSRTASRRTGSPSSPHT